MKSQLKLLNSYKWSGPEHYNYGVNSQGYRCPEFDTVNWSNSVLMFGCSNTFGIGVKDTDTVSYILSSTLNIPVINLAMGASSCTYQWINSTILRTNNIQPRAVIYIWPEDARQSIFYNNDIYETQAVGIWSVGENLEYSKLGMKILLDPYHAPAIAKYQKDNVSVLWNCPVLQYTWLPESDNSVKSLPSVLDKALDKSHPGPKTHSRWAKFIASDLKKLL